MRILIISNLFPPDVLGGYEILCEQVTSGLHREGHEIAVLTTGQANQDTYPYSVFRTLELFLPFSHAAHYARMRRLITSRKNYAATAACIRSFKPDIIFIWSQLRLTVGSAQAAEDSGLPVAYTFNDEHIAGYFPRQSGWLGTLKGLLDNQVLKITATPLRLQHTTCISQTLKRRLCEQGVAIPSSKVIFQGIPIHTFPQKNRPGSLSTKLKVLYVGQLHPYKGVHTVIEAVAQLHKQGHQLELTVCGKGTDAYERELHALAATTEADVRFLGRIPHASLPEIYRYHDVFVFSSTWAEPFGLTHLEAMASGTPVVSTAEGGHGEFLRDGVNALIFQPNSALELADRIEQLIRDPSLAVRLAAQARKQVEQEFSLEAYTKRLEAWLASIVPDAGSKGGQTWPAPLATADL